MFKLKSLGQDIGRLTEIIVIISKYGFGSFLEAKGLTKKKHSESPPPLTSSATRFCAMLEELGPTFVKVGQLLSTRADLLPPDFIAALSKLQDKVPPFGADEAKKAIEEALNAKVLDVFAEFNETPLASGSIAQVHRAKLPDGSEVIVKVRRPKIKEIIARDAGILQLLAYVLEGVVAEASFYQATSFTEEFTRALTKELDFSNEAHNLQLFARYNANRAAAYCPKFYEELSTENILTMEFIDGKRITDFPVEDAITKKIVENLLDLNFDHIFIDGIFHADPHPGNILITPSQQIAFIDFGSVGKITRDHQDQLLGILIALALNDADTLARMLLRLGQPRRRIKLAKFKTRITRLLEDYAGLSLGQIPSKNALADILQSSLEFGISMPKEFALLVKSSATIEGIVRSLYPSLNVYERSGERAQELLSARLDPKNFRSASLRMGLQLATAAQDLPMQLNQALLDLERGETQVMVKVQEIEVLGQKIENGALIICAGLISAACVLGGFHLSWQAEYAHSALRWLPFVVAAVLTGGCTAWVASSRKFPKLSLLRRRL